MFSALILAITTAALVQFGMFYWRALVVCTAAEAVSEEVLSAAQVETGSIRGEDYRSLAQLHKLTPELCAQSSGLGLVPAYFRVLQAVKSVTAGRVATLAQWAESESALCARYAAVQVERRLRANMELAASMHSC